MPEGYNLIEFDSIDSTSEEAKRIVKSGSVSDRTIICAKTQTAGHGRYGRQWQSPEGNLYASIVFKIDTELGEAAHYSFLSALAVGESVLEFADASIEYKWPNDVLLNGRKVAGILLESLQDSRRQNWMIIGVGVNINNQPEVVEKPVTSLSFVSGGAINPRDFLTKFTQVFDLQEKLWKNEGFSCIRGAWLKKAYRLGQQIQVNLSNKTIKGKFEGISRSGELELLVDGKMMSISSGEVFFE